MTPNLGYPEYLKAHIKQDKIWASYDIDQIWVSINLRITNFVLVSWL